jgi:hypothetical protein
MADIRRLRADDERADVVRVLEEDGAVIIERLFPDDVLARCNTELDPFVADAAPDHQGAFVNPAIAYFFGSQTRHVTGVAGKSHTFAGELMVHPTLLGVCDSVLGDNCASYILNLAHLLDRGPGSEQQLWHRDELVWVHLPSPHREVQVATMIALVDFTADNGATRIVPGSHRWPADRQPTAGEIAVAEMPAGSVAIYLGSTLHAGGANVTDAEWRRGMHCSYVVGWLRTEENQYLASPLESVRGLPRRSLELLGYGAHDAIASGGGYLGTVELQDPVELIAAGKL